MNFTKKFFLYLLISLTLSSCGLSKRVYLTKENRIALSPRGYSADAYHKLDEHKRQDIQRRNRKRAIALIITANALIFTPMFLNQDSDGPQK
ncbi:hypothetical protein BH23BAC1_BH23BAC1_04370 [soil metagenome]